jgi:hypothetical protein
VRLVSPIGGTTGGNGNPATSLSNVARVAAHSKFVWVFNANYDGTIIYNDPVHTLTMTQIWTLFVSTLSNNLVGKISTHFKNTPLYIMFYKMYANAK